MNTPKQPGSDSSLSRQDWHLVLAAVLLSLALKLLFATHRGFWLDELWTLQAVLLPFREMVADRLHAGHSPVPFFYVQLFHELFGSSELALKSSSAIAAGMALLASAGLLGELGLRRYLVPFLVLGTFHPYWQHIGTELRYPMLVVAVAALWAWALTVFIREGGAGYWLASALLGALTLWLHGSSQFIFAGLFVFALLAGRAAPQGKRLMRTLRNASSVGASYLLSVPFLLLLEEYSSYAKRSGIPSLDKALVNQLRTYFGTEQTLATLTGLPTSFFAILILVVSLAALMVSWRALRHEVSQEARSFLIGSLVALPLATMIYTYFGKNIQGNERYVAFSSTGMLMLLAIGWAESRRRCGTMACRTGRGMFAVLVAACFLVATFNEGDWQREAIHWLAKVRRVDDPIIVSGRSMNIFAMSYHGQIEEGTIVGISEEKGTPELLYDVLRQALADADVGYLFLYRKADLEEKLVLVRLRREGFLMGQREWEATASLQMFALARTEEGLRRMEELPDMPMPRITHRRLPKH